MSRRRPFVRFVTLLLATLQVASPGISAVADGQLARDSASRPATHVEATTTAACPVVHHPDCGVCRYLSQFATVARQGAADLQLTACTVEPQAASRTTHAVTTACRYGRAPPAV